MVQVQILAKVRDSAAFTGDNDLHGEHDFGSLEVDRVDRVFWKIDYYADNQMQGGSEHSDDPAGSFRVLTVVPPRNTGAGRSIIGLDE